MTAGARVVDAVTQGDADAVARLLAEDAGLAEARAGGVPLVLLALYHGHPAVAEVVAAHRRALGVHELAALGRARELAAALRRAPVEADRFAPDGHTPLGLAAYFGHAEAVRVLLDAGADPRAPSRNQLRVAPLHAAVARRASAVAVLLLDHGADPNARQARGVTALHQAAAAGERDLAELLVERGADPSVLDDEGRSATDLALMRGHIGLAEWLAGVCGG